MNKDELRAKLGMLPQLDIDITHAYDQAINNIENETIREELSRFRQDHLNHLAELSKLLRELGATPPEYSPEFKGFMTSGFTSLRYISGTSGSLKALMANENLVHRKYRQVGESESTEPALTSVIDEHLEDERRHLSYLEETIGRIYARFTS